MKITGVTLKKLIHERATEIEVGGAADLERRTAIEHRRRAAPFPTLAGYAMEEVPPNIQLAHDELQKAEQEHFRISVSEALSGQARWMRTIADLMDPHTIFDLSIAELIQLNLWPSGKLGESTTFGTRAIL